MVGVFLLSILETQWRSGGFKLIGIFARTFVFLLGRALFAPLPVDYTNCMITTYIVHCNWSHWDQLQLVGSLQKVSLGPINRKTALLKGPSETF